VIRPDPVLNSHRIPRTFPLFVARFTYPQAQRQSTTSCRWNNLIVFSSFRVSASLMETKGGPILAPSVVVVALGCRASSNSAVPVVLRQVLLELRRCKRTVAREAASVATLAPWA
jgi:hypothetical protein